MLKIILLNKKFTAEFLSVLVILSIFKFLKLEKKGFGNEIQLTDSLISLIDSPGLYASEFDGKRFDCGSKLGFIEANISFGINDKEISKNLRKIISKL